VIDVRVGEDQLLERITRTIVENLRPRRIVLFGSRARGSAARDSDYDIMVEMETNLPDGEREDAVYDLFPDHEWSMDVLVYTPEDVQRWKDDVGVVMYDIVREGRVLYCRPDAPDVGSERGVSGSPAPRVRERPRGVPQSVASWMRRAQNDFVTMERMAASSSPPWDVVCFHAHQSAEKLLKACLVARWVRPPRTHNLRRLLDTCRRAGVDLPGLRRPCENLQRLYPRSRYPKEAEPSASDAGTAIAAATAVRSAMLSILERAVQDPSS
jgi:HEPN domain-containing protein/predicted nucleotidyltransferase